MSMLTEIVAEYVESVAQIDTETYDIPNEFLESAFSSIIDDKFDKDGIFGIKENNCL